ncbi:hypothetical protein DXA14_07715 [Hungatella hathewayi]|nr:hypothetical protein [Hungatella sp. L36]MBS6756967.1 hypothetical protein [Hungatella hathewayi]MBT9796849.1 hypothetical protein [Hungatella hathewayi]MUB62635.1 hypothetical protein [Hungatella hathewayi]RGJ06215.1 hypothetical protein DXD79_08900 [Hungatella hathewayi]
MAFKYGLGIKDVRRLAIPKLNAEQMRQTVYAVLENVDSELIELCCQGTFDQYQIPEIVSGSVSGLTKEEILSYATPDLPASRMKKMRSQLIEAKKNASDTAEGTAFREYTENLIKMMETSLQQFKENNEKFEVLSSLVKEHVLDEKNQEIKDLYDNLKEKDNLIKKLQEEAAGREAQIKDLEAKLSDVKVQTVQGAEKSIEIERAGKKPVPTSYWRPEPPQTAKKTLLDKLFPQKTPDILDKIAAEGLSSEQLEEIRSAFDSGLSDMEVMRIIKKDLTADKMRKMREIMMLVRERRLADE